MHVECDVLTGPYLQLYNYKSAVFMINNRKRSAAFLQFYNWKKAELLQFYNYINSFAKKQYFNSNCYILDQ